MCTVYSVVTVIAADIATAVDSFHRITTATAVAIDVFDGRCRNASSNLASVIYKKNFVIRKQSNHSASTRSTYILWYQIEMGRYHIFDFDMISIRYLENIAISISIFSK